MESSVASAVRYKGRGVCLCVSVQVIDLRVTGRSGLVATTTPSVQPHVGVDTEN